MINFFHKLLNPHCQQCADEMRESKVNETVEVLKSELTAMRYQNEQLLKVITDLHKPPVVQELTQEVTKSVNSGTIPWRIRQQMLENEARQAAVILRNKQAESAESKKSTEQLEKELLGDDNAMEQSDEQMGKESIA